MCHIETLYNQIEDSVELADVEQTTYTAEQVVSIAYAVVFVAGSLRIHTGIGNVPTLDTRCGPIPM